MQGLDWQTLQVPLAAGLAQGVDARAMKPPGLAVCRDVQFDEQGGLQTRKPYAALGSNIFGGGTIANARKLVVNGDELLLFTSDTLYSWNAQLSAWVSKGTHLAVKVDEESRFVTTADQLTCDRAELNGTIVFAWVESSVIYVAAVDKTTNSVLLAPTATSAGDTRPRLVALTTKILLFVATGDPELQVYAIDPASPGTAIAGSTTVVLGSPDFNLYYDAVKIPGADAAFFACRRTTTTSHTIGKVTAGLVVTTSTKARTADGPLAVAVDPTGAVAQIIRGNGTNIQGDRITVSSLADAATGQAIGTATGTPVNQIAAAYRSVQNGGQYRCYAFWSAEETSGVLGFQCKTNHVDTGGSIGAQSTLRLRLGVASRAFDHGGQVYVWLAFAGTSGAAGMGEPIGFRAQLQNTYFLYRDDGHLVAKAAWQRGGGFSPAIGWLPGVALTSGSTTYSWCAVERRIIQLGNKHTGYDARAPRDCTFTFDSNEARRCVRLGLTLYVSGGMLLQYDRVGLFELGFQVYPWLFTSTAIGGGLIPAGEYAYKSTLRWDNGQGERERSTTATGELATSAGTQKLQFQIANLHVTRKGSKPAVEMWRTTVNPEDEGANFHLVSSVDPASSGDNEYIANTDTSAFTPTFVDNMIDADLLEQPSFDQDGVLEQLAPPAATILIATDTRVFLAGIAGDPDRVWYSRQRNDGEIVSFFDGLTFLVPAAGGRITGLAFENETLVVFRETATYAFPGEGLDNAGGGQVFGPSRLIAADVGAVSQEAIGVTPKGILFKSSKGWQLLTPGWGVEYIGDKVSGFDGDTVVAVHVLEGQHHVRCVTTSRILMWDYLAGGPDGELGQWSEWTEASGLDAVLWQGTHAYLTATGPRVEQASYSGLTFGIDVETGWIKLNDLQGFARVRRAMLLGEFRSAHGLRWQIARDYKATFDQDSTWTATPATVGGPLQVRRTIKRQQCQAIKFRITAVKAAIQATLDADTDYSTGPLALAGATTWGAILEARPIGADGNGIQLVINCKLGAARIIEVRDRQVWDPDTDTWSDPQEGKVGVKLVATDNGGASPATAAQLEAAINARSELVRVATAHGSPSAQVDMSAMDGQQLIGTLGDTTLGVDADNNTPPTGEALKLTGLALEVGLKRGINRRLPATQKR